MQNVLLIGASGGIGSALNEALKVRGASVTGLSRARDGFDLTVPDEAEARLSEFQGPFDTIIVASGALASAAGRPEKSLAELDAVAMQAQFAVNATGPALVLKHAPRLMPRNAPCLFAAISAKVGSIGDNRLGGWYSYRASKAALNQIVHTGAIELARSHKQSVCVTLHPGTVDTRFTASYPAHKKTAPKASAANLLNVLSGLTPKDTGKFYNWDGSELPW